LILDATGNLYGTTIEGGNFDCGAGFGTVFKRTPSANGKSAVTVLHAFCGPDGYGPTSSLIFDAAGNLYGTTVFGGNFGGYCGIDGCGVVFEITP
jgi:uncharacterized repeat protein (TIGR03803 family)